MRKLSEDVKVDIAIWPQSVTSSGTTSTYFKMDNYSRAKFVWCSNDTNSAYLSVSAGGTSAQLLTTSTGTLLQATSETGANSATIGTATVSMYTRVIEFGVGPALAITEGETVSITGYDINGDSVTALTFTATSSGTAAASTGRNFSTGATTAGNTANVSSMCTNLAAILNDATYGVPGAYATAVSGAVTIRSVSGENMFSVTSSNTTTLTLGATRIMGMLEVEASQLTLSSSFTHVAINVVNEISAFTSAYIIRSGRRRKMPVQMVGALATAD